MRAILLLSLFLLSELPLLADVRKHQDCIRLFDFQYELCPTEDSPGSFHVQSSDPERTEAVLVTSNVVAVSIFSGALSGFIIKIRSLRAIDQNQSLSVFNHIFALSPIFLSGALMMIYRTHPEFIALALGYFFGLLCGAYGAY